MDAPVTIDDLDNVKIDRGTDQRHSLRSFETMLPAHELQHGVDGNRRHLIETFVKLHRKLTPRPTNAHRAFQQQRCHEDKSG